MRFSVELLHYPAHTIGRGTMFEAQVPDRFEVDTTRVSNVQWAIVPSYEPLGPTRIVLAGDLEDHICPLLGETPKEEFSE